MLRLIFWCYAVGMAIAFANLGLFFQANNQVDAALFVPALTFAAIALALRP